ncbi:MAG TPA: hypothetical protein VEA99_01095 [Gemmatimonadaceae bacterium]|nr:hypothetical protein [Gemmatimonadaceae bacterium]
MIAIVLGALLALASLAWVLAPLRSRVPTESPAAALPSVDGPRCARCGVRPEPDARYCSSCGAPLSVA